jgi:DHA2 family multidrug resistance protein-like MFS transporter
MGAAPAHQAGSAAAVEEMSYEVGAVLGVAVLGSVAGAVYRAGLPANAPAPVTESLGNALDTSFAATASTAFTDGFAVVGLLGGLIALATALLVHRQLPADLDLSAGHD